jgi:hypothetical protein
MEQNDDVEWESVEDKAGLSGASEAHGHDASGHCSHAAQQGMVNDLRLAFGDRLSEYLCTAQMQCALRAWL